MARKFYQKTWFIFLMLLFFFPIGITLAFVNPFYPSKAKKVVAGIGGIFLLIVFIDGLFFKDENLSVQEDRTIAQDKTKPQESEGTELAPPESVARPTESSTPTNKMSSRTIIEIVKPVDDIGAEILKFLQTSEQDSIPTKIYNLYAEESYADFPMKSISLTRRGNILRKDAIPNEWRDGKYNYEIINGFWNGKTNYPILNQENGMYRFDLKRNDTSRNILVLDVNSITYSAGVIYVNILSVSNNIDFGTDDKKADSWLIESYTPTLHRFVFFSRDNVRNQKIQPLNKAEAQAITNPKDIFVMHESTELNPLSWKNIKNDVRQWYDPTLIGKESFRGESQDFSSSLHVSGTNATAENLASAFSNDSTSLYYYKDILLFAIYKLKNDWR